VRIIEFDIQAILSTRQDVRDQMEETAKKTILRVGALTSECKQLSDRGAQKYEHLTEYLELRRLEAHLQEANQQAFSV
jgi:hypothetical protein